jgi:hypothetical protein
MNPNYDKIFFLHISKTAGTSVVSYFTDKFGPDLVLEHGDFIKIAENNNLTTDIK